MSNTITGQMQSATPWILAMDPCQTVSVQIVTASGSRHPSGNGNIYFRLRNAAHDILAETSIVCGMSCSGTLPGTNDVAGYPAQGMRGVEGNPADILVSTGWFNWFGGPTASYTLTIPVAPRAGYNRGGTSFANALMIDTGVEQKGSLHWREPGQFYRVHLDVGQLLFLRGELTAHYWWASYFNVTLYDENQQQLQVMVNEAVYNTKTFPAAGTAGLVYRNDGAARDFYLKVRAKYYPIWDFKFTAVTPRLTLSPASITRGDTATFTVEDAPGGTLSNWRYDITDEQAIATVARTADTGADTWPGQLVVSGTGKVTLGLGGLSTELQKPVTVTPRNWGLFPAVTPTPQHGQPFVATGVCPLTKPYAHPGDVRVAGREGVAQIAICLSASAEHSEHLAVSDGPNKDVKWLQDVHDTSVIDWGMHPEIEDSLSAFTAANWGTFPVGSQVCSPTPTLGNGFMLASTFRDQIARHEVGSSNSHYADYVTEINKPSLNFRPNLEGVVGPPSLPLLVPEPGHAATFKNNVKVKVGQLRNAWFQEYVKHSEPCSAQCDGLCSNHIGDWNTRNASGVYPACPVPAPFGVPPFTSIGDQPFASKGRVQ